MVWQRMGTHTDVDNLNAGGHQPFQLLSHAGVFLWCFAAVAATQKSAKVNVLSCIAGKASPPLPQSIQAGHTGADLVCFQAVHHCNFCHFGSFPASGRYKMRWMPHSSASTMSIRCKREKGNKREQIKSSARRYFFFPQQFLYFLPLPQGQGAFLAGVPAIVAAGAVFALNSAAISPR